MAVRSLAGAGQAPPKTGQRRSIQSNVFCFRLVQGLHFSSRKLQKLDLKWHNAVGADFGIERDVFAATRKVSLPQVPPGILSQVSPSGTDSQIVYSNYFLAF
jgi:hypothetical protein